MCKDREYGGFIPFEFSQNEGDYFTKFNRFTKRVNSGRTAIVYALKQINSKRVWLPHYNCPLLKDIVEECGFEVLYYRLTENFMPIIDNYESEDTLVWVNLFGLLPLQTKNRIAENYSNVVIDNTQAFYAEPILRENVFNAYSCRKFFGVPDGGYVIGLNLKSVHLESDFSWNRMSHLFKSIELGTNEAYQEYSQNEDMISNTYASMSKVTEMLLCTVDYNAAAIARRNNFNVLYEELRNVNGLDFRLDDKQVPFVFPFFNKSNGLRENLVNKNVYVPTWWRHINDIEFDVEANKTLEWNYANYLMPLPLDQRYKEEDMLNLASIIKGVLLKCNS